MLPEDLRQLLLAFNAHGVEYLVVGGYAVGIYAEPRATKDLDLFIRSDVRNSEAVFRALIAYGAPVAGMSPADFRDDPGSVFQIGQPPARVDLLQHIDSVAFDEAWNERVEASVGGVIAHVISPINLYATRFKTGRMRDLADVEAIREAQEQDEVS